MASFSRTLYVGMTSNLKQRVYQHKHKVFPGFTAQYNASRLVYWEPAPDAMSAILREKELKRWTRERKVKLIEFRNPKWEDLAARWFLPPRRTRFDAGPFST